jgi:hypothetical protein
MNTKLHIEYANPDDLSDSILVEFALRDYRIVQEWAERVKYAQKLYTIDDPARFYGFGPIERQKADAIYRINQCVDIINKRVPIINRRLTYVEDQDTLNYLHSIFEKYHGLLGMQDGEYWQNAGPEVKQALADLNIAVHRCETVARGAEPRHVVTWFGMPKTEMYRYKDYEDFAYLWDAGTVFLNYVEIGKTMEDLYNDNDQYISRDAFKPFRHWSADFVVRYSPQTLEQCRAKRSAITKFYYDHEKFFGDWRPEYTFGSLPVADIITNVDLKDIESRQFVKSVNFV